jgi:hypothetical protein
VAAEDPYHLGGEGTARGTEAWSARYSLWLERDFVVEDRQPAAHGVRLHGKKVYVAREVWKESSGFSPQ